MTATIPLKREKRRAALRKLWSILLTTLISVSIISIPVGVLVAAWTMNGSWLVVSMVAAILGAIFICIRWHEVVMEEHAEKIS